VPLNLLPACLETGLVLGEPFLWRMNTLADINVRVFWVDPLPDRVIQLDYVDLVLDLACYRTGPPGSRLVAQSIPPRCQPRCRRQRLSAGRKGYRPGTGPARKSTHPKTSQGVGPKLSRRFYKPQRASLWPCLVGLDAGCDHLSCCQRAVEDARCIRRYECAGEQDIPLAGQQDDRGQCDVLGWSTGLRLITKASKR
jgi:hypothetical protein